MWTLQLPLRVSIRRHIRRSSITAVIGSHNYSKRIRLGKDVVSCFTKTLLLNLLHLVEQIIFSQTKKIEEEFKGSVFVRDWKEDKDLFNVELTSVSSIPFSFFHPRQSHLQSENTNFIEHQRKYIVWIFVAISFFFVTVKEKKK